MRFTKVFIATKPDMYDDIRKNIEKFLDDNKVGHTDKKEEHINLVITIGGDGTLLHYQNDFHCPILGINGGDSVGHYLAAGPGDYMEKVKKTILGFEGKDYSIRKLMRLAAEINKEPVNAAAVNEVIVSALYTRKMLHSELTIDNKTSLEMNTAILAYTSQGSTAFAGSAGVRPADFLEGRFGVCAVAPYKGSLKKGPALSAAHVTVIPLNDEAELSIDGQDQYTFKIGEGDIVTIKKAEVPLRLIWL
ncbi:MAG: NAD(+)/NADH kinase [Candidatus Aenigmarchaeota archaeon]|nr:NAD(+)/NADH kinase [Candidatus Aenigmarchaeota archaeon]